MSRIYVAIDLETTGLDSERDAIIEIGAIKFRDQKILSTFHSLINPGRPLPRKIVELTGITQNEVDTAPSLFSQLPRLARFVGDRPVVGHNVSFDLAFLQRHDTLLDQVALDTWELASVLVPHASRYSLGALADELLIELPASHRALDDARVTHALFVALFERAASLPSKTLQEIVKAAKRGRWSAAWFFEDALRAAARETFGSTIGAQLAAQLDKKAAGPLFAPPIDAPPLRPKDELDPIDVAGVAVLLDQEGPLAQNFPGYEHRPQQVAMLRRVAETFNRGDHLLVEAGTGTGKSLAYLLPAVHWAVRNGERVLISTNTINLQEQLITKDVPELQALLPFDFRAMVLKGRGHYLCLAQLNRLRRQGPRSPEAARLLAKILVWLPGTLTGDDEELSLPLPVEQTLWRRLSADHEGCVPDRCAVNAQGRCFFYRARRQAEASHLIIVNHALLLADIAVANRALPEYKYLIVDEAHHLEQVTTGQLSFEANRGTMLRMLNEVGRARQGRPATGLLGDLLLMSRQGLPREVRDRLGDVAHEIGQTVDRAYAQTAAFFDALDLFTQEFVGERSSSYAHRIRVDSGLRVQPGWASVEIAWDNAAVYLQSLVDDLRRLGSGLDELEAFNPPGLEDVQAYVVGVERRLGEAVGQLDPLVSDPDEQSIYWVSVGPEEGQLSLNAAPLHVGTLVEEHLFHKKSSVVMTSATLRVAQSFDFIRERLNAWEVDELAVGSPFDYASSTLVYLVDDIPEPRHPGQAGHQAYQRSLEAGLVALCQATEGRALVLFTAYHQLRATAQAISGPLARAGITVYEQGDGTSRRQLLENFKNSQQAVLLGTRSFWEGVDVPGEALSCLAIVRLPFSVPTDPIFAARAETFDQPFFEYSVPDAVLRFLQGFGRLIRTRTDRGVVAVFDKRLLTKSYGSAFLDSLPEPMVRQGPMASLPAAAARWIAGE